jgi:salicylate hydroxylase
VALQAVVVGGGLGGMAAAVALAQAGIDVQVHEQAHELTEVGAGVSLAPNGLRMLERLGLGEAVERAGVRYMWAQLTLSDGRPARHEPDQFTRPGRNLGIHRADLLALLAAQLPPGTVRTGHRCTGFSQDASTATATFADGSTATADVVIGADGIHSVLQEFVVAPAKPVFSGVVAYRGLVSRIEACRADGFQMWVGESKHFLVFPVRAGQLLNYVGFVPSDTSVRESWSARGDTAALAAHFAGWDPVIGQVIAAISGPGGSGFQGGMYDRAPLPRWSSGRLTLLGDAAHPMLPFYAQGAGQAIEDAAALATFLASGSESLPAALARYERLRLLRASRVQEASRGRTAHHHLPDGPEQRARDAAFAAEDPLSHNDWIYSYDAEYEAATANRCDPVPGS